MVKFFGRAGFLALFFMLATGLFSANATAQGWHGGHHKAYVVGTVSSIDINGRSFTVANDNGDKTEVRVSPLTKFKLKSTDRRFKIRKHHSYVQFSDLKAGDWVRAKIYETQNAGWMTKDVHIYVDSTMTGFVDPTRPGNSSGRGR